MLVKQMGQSSPSRKHPLGLSLAGDARIEDWDHHGIATRPQRSFDTQRAFIEEPRPSGSGLSHSRPDLFLTVAALITHPFRRVATLDRTANRRRSNSDVSPLSFRSRFVGDYSVIWTASASISISMAGSINRDTSTMVVAGG